MKLDLVMKILNKNGSFKEDLFLLLSQTINKSHNILQHFNDYIVYCEKKKIHHSTNAILFTYNQLRSTLSFLKNIQNTLRKRCNTNTLMKLEIEI